MADYFTKPLCGEKFKHFRNKIMDLSSTKLIPPWRWGGGDKSVSKPESNMTQVAGSSVERSMKMMKCKAISKLKKTKEN